MANKTVRIFCGGTVIYGKEIVSLLLARALRDAGWPVSFITSRWNSPPVTAWLQASGFPCEFLWLGFISATLRLDPLLCTYGQMVRWPEMIQGFRRIVAADRQQVIVHTNWQHALLLLPALEPRRDIFWLHEIVPENRRYAWIFRSIAAKVGKFVCVSCAVADRLRSLGIADSKIAVVYNATSLDGDLAADVDGRALRLGIVGQVGPWKGHDDVIDALTVLARENIRPSLHIFGTGGADYIDHLKRRIAELKLQDQVAWHGLVEDQAAIYDQIDVCVIASRVSEGFGMSAVEAAAFGRPAICSNRGALPEVVVDGVTGFVVDRERPEQLISAVAKFVSRPELVRIMGGAAKERALIEFSPERLVGQFAKVIQATAGDAAELMCRRRTP